MMILILCRVLGIHVWGSPLRDGNDEYHWYCLRCGQVMDA